MKNSRRNFIKTGIATGVGLAIAPTFSSENVGGPEKVRIAFIGVVRGRNHLTNILLRDDVIVPAICDIDPVALNEAQKLITEYNQPMPKLYTGSDYACMDLLSRNDIDDVIIAPWLWHTRTAVATMKAGKHCMILENVCCRRDIMAVIQMEGQVYLEKSSMPDADTNMIFGR